MSESTIKEFRAWLETQEELRDFSPTEPAVDTIIDALDEFEESVVVERLKALGCGGLWREDGCRCHTSNLYYYCLPPGIGDCKAAYASSETCRCLSPEPDPAKRGHHPDCAHNIPM